VSETLAQECRSVDLGFAIESLTGVEAGQMTERNAVTIASRQLRDESPKKARPNSVILKAGIDMHASEHEMALLVRSSDKADRPLMEGRDIYPIGGFDTRAVAPRAVQSHERRIVDGSSNRNIYMNHDRRVSLC
jgi:hypothetical protein